MPEAAPAKPASTIRVEVVYAEPQRRIMRVAILAAEATVEQAIRTSGIRDELPAGFAAASVGIFGRVVALDAPLRDGGRIELYRPLRIDPKQARRRRAEKQK